MFRILPLFYALLIFWLVVNRLVFGVDIHFGVMALNYFCVFGLIPGQHEGIVWASWSIGVEMLFYMVFPLALSASYNLLSSFFVFIATFVISVASQNSLEFLRGEAPSFPYMAISTQAVFFGAGLFSYRLGEHIVCATAHWSEKRKHIFAEAVLIAGLGSVVIYWSTPLAHLAAQFHVRTQILAVAWILMLAPILLKGQLKTLAFSPLERAGTISFSLYLLNPALIFFLAQTGIFKALYGQSHSPNLAFVMCLLVALGLLWILSAITFRLIEEKGILLGSGLLNKVMVSDFKQAYLPKSAQRFGITGNVTLMATLPWLAWGVLSMTPAPSMRLGSNSVIFKSAMPIVAREYLILNKTNKAKRHSTGRARQQPCYV